MFKNEEEKNMKREDAILLSKIYKVQKEIGREVQVGDIVSRMIIPNGSCKQKLEEFKELGFLEETVLLGANQYSVTLPAIDQMCAYRDVKRDIDEIRD